MPSTPPPSPLTRVAETLARRHGPVRPTVLAIEEVQQMLRERLLVARGGAPRGSPTTPGAAPWAPRQLLKSAVQTALASPR